MKTVANLKSVSCSYLITISDFYLITRYQKTIKILGSYLR
ncbi:hypothetical protein PROSTU_03144 [Providencia stuartii ATCC 25827]|uniref:Uncharacterized protein n=1 Tax=Providencia stuartii ATCC 25827 TaxID=471874 RepID=A0AA86Z033_PROST|nr:hypothetical protein PROSTU_03144 [Providencia stuartii ATCC 25827]